MEQFPRRSARAVLVCGSLLVGQVLMVSLPTSNAKAEQSCLALRQWARAYAGTSPTLDHLSQFDRAHRLAIFNAVTPDVRATLWRDQLQRFGERADLSAEQRAFVRAARAELVPAMYEQIDALASRESARQFWATAAPLFPSREHQRAWFDLGAVVEPARPAASAGLLERLATPFTAVAQTPWCECSYEWGSIECYPGQCGGGGICSSYVGCGPEGRSWCTALCNF